jgi:hypothetical protein
MINNNKKGLLLKWFNPPITHLNEMTMDQNTNTPNINGSLPESESPMESSRREALRKIAKFSTYAAPAMLATISGKASAVS